MKNLLFFLLDESSSRCCVVPFFQLIVGSHKFKMSNYWKLGKSKPQSKAASSAMPPEFCVDKAHSDVEGRILTYVITGHNFWPPTDL
jgi:hypothetical protein